MEIKGFTIVNEEKFNRVINGSLGPKGQLRGGVGENATDEAKLAEYDRLGGLIREGKYNIKIGSFYDFAKKCAKATPEIIYLFRDYNDKEIEVPKGDAIPLEVKAAEVRKENAEKKSTILSTAGKSKGKKKASVEDEE